LGELFGGVTLNQTNRWLLEAEFLAVPLQFEFDYKTHTKDQVEDCMTQMADFFHQLDHVDDVQVFTVHEKGFTDEVVRLEQFMVYCACEWSCFLGLHWQKHCF